MEQKPSSNQSLQAKLLEIGKQIVTFAVSEESEKKKAGTSTSSYRFTPGYEIVERVRAKLDAAGIKLEPNCKSETHEMISYPVYKLINNSPYRFDVQQMYVTVNVEYRFIDTATGEVAGPFTQIAAGANGIDKSISSALSLAERYFLLKYFQITTREPDTEPDLHDSEDIPGFGNQQPVTATEKDVLKAKAVNQGQPAAPVPAQGPAPVNPQLVQMSQQMIGAVCPQNRANETYEKAVESLMYFEQGTESHNKSLAYWMTQLRLAGFDTSAPDFAQTLSLTAQSRRIGGSR